MWPGCEMAPRSTSIDVQVLFSFPVGFESFCMIMSVPLKDAAGRAPVTGVRNWQECNATQVAILWSYSNATYWQKLQGDHYQIFSRKGAKIAKTQRRARCADAPLRLCD